MKTFLISLCFSLLFLTGCQSTSGYDLKAHFGECPINGQLCKVCEQRPHPNKSIAPIYDETSLNEPVWERIQRRGKVIVGVKADTPPFSVMNEDKTFWGFEVDLMSAIAAEMEVEVEMVPVSAKQRIPYLLQNKVDLVMATMTLTKKREARVDFSTPYFQVGQGLVTANGSRIQSFQDLAGKKVAVVEGTQAFHTLGRLQPDARLINVSSYEKGLDKVIAGDVSALCSDHLILMGLFHNHKTPEKLALVEQTFAPDSYAIAMRENESSLRDAVNASIMTTWEDGTWPDAFDTWFGPGSMYFHESNFSIQLVPE
jgi:ABC-type amino acid transport substrate-binding protein